jgi:integrase
VKLSGARTQREAARASLALHSDPSTVKKAAKRAAKLSIENSFEAVARKCLANQRNRLAPRYFNLLLARLEADIFPQIGPRPVSDVDAPELLEALRKVEKRGAIETARRLRQICGQVFRYAIATGLAKYDPSAALRGALGSPGRPRGHKAMPLKEIPTFLKSLAAYDGDVRTRFALRLMILTFARTTELRSAQWTEFENLEGHNPLWRVKYVATTKTAPLWL